MQSVRLSKVEKQAFRVIKITVNRNTVWGFAIAQVIQDPTPEKVKELFQTICEQWQDNPEKMFKILGFFDLPKFLGV